MKHDLGKRQGTEYTTIEAKVRSKVMKNDGIFVFSVDDCVSEVIAYRWFTSTTRQVFH
jgi:hypothetical protein